MAERSVASDSPTVTSTGATASPAQGASQSVGSIVGDIANDLATLLRKEIELAKAEVRTEASSAAKAGGMFGGAGVGGLIAAIFFSLALMFALSAWFDISLGWTALIVGVLWAIVGAVLFTSARNRMKHVDPVPHQTIATLKEGI